MADSVYQEITRDWSLEKRSRFSQEQFTFLSTTGSTNDDLLDAVRAGEAGHFHVIAADTQTRGRGRRGDRWEGGAGRNLLFSLSLRLGPDRAKWSRLPHLAAAVVGRAVESVLPAEIRLQTKWPNDLLCGGRKLAGILVETTLTPEPCAIVGIGLNVNLRLEDLPEGLRGATTSLYEILDCESSRWFILGLILEGFLETYPDIDTKFDEVLDWLALRDFLGGKSVRVITAGEVIEGRSDGLGRDGELLVRVDENAVRRVVSAEKLELC